VRTLLKPVLARLCASLGWTFALLLLQNAVGLGPEADGPKTVISF